MNEESVGFIDLEIEDGGGDVTVYVRPEFRQRGIGSALLGLLIGEVRDLEVMQLVAHIEHDNTASIRCALRAGFSQVDDNEDGVTLTRALG